MKELFRLIIIALILLAKCYIFEYSLVSYSLSWTIADIFIKSAAAILIALLATITQRNYPIFIVLVITDIWLMANIVYFRANHLFITWHLLWIVNNLDGFESSVLPYLSWELCLFPLLTLVTIVLCWLSFKKMKIGIIISVCVCGAFLSLCGSYCRWKEYRAKCLDSQLTLEWFNPFEIPKCLSAHISEFERQPCMYISHRSILSYPLYMLNDAVRSIKKPNEQIELTDIERQELDSLIDTSLVTTPIHSSLLIILLESFESWLLNVKDANNEPICPMLNDYISSHNVLYVKDATTQIGYGMSGDGQMIINTGLYPTLEGVACVDYGYNTYPGIAHMYPYSAIVNPCRNVWNQNVVSSSYGYKQLIEPESDDRFEWNDSIVMDKIISTINHLDTPFCVMGITVSGHIPFTQVTNDIPISDTVPILFKNYMQTAHFTDRQLGRLLLWADTAVVAKGGTIAITGDHRIFHAWLGDDIKDYGVRANLPFGTGQAGCPFILVNKNINNMVYDSCNQIDIFSTILAAIGQETYYWRGMGRDLLNETIGEYPNMELRRQLSDKLIRMDYFATLSH